ncbi:MAG TPA: L-2-hydroxyglutarate oxidase [Candidatus Limnocylindrales bacterium]|jgi:L-2-hydroxyglutarate oxidase LhgO
MTVDRADVLVVGGGIVGLATAYQLLRRTPDVRLALIEREPALATHQSGHNSGVLHAGLYYAPGSLKARLCREGKAELEAFALAHAIPFRHTGKLVVAVDEPELPRFEALRTRAEANGVPGLEVVGPERMREIEPHTRGLRGLWSPTTGIIDYRAICLALAEEITSHGGTIELGRTLTGSTVRGAQVIAHTSAGDIVTDGLVVCAGLWADEVAARTGEPVEPRIVPFRGDYYTITADARSLVRGLIYPVPDPAFPFLGVHLTTRIDGEVWAGPNAILALARTGYRRRDVSVRDLAATVTYPGFLRLAARHVRMGAAEMWRDVSKRAFLQALQRYVPELRGDQLRFGPSGVRAQALDRDGTLVDDFRLGGRGRILHVRNAPSPAATSSLAIGRMLADTALERFAAA